MASKSFEINTEPHVADVGGTRLMFKPEVIGAEYATAYASLREAQKAVGGSKPSSSKHAKDEDLSPDTLLRLHNAMRGFIGRFLVDESQPVFESMQVPDRILVQLLEWVSELYGGGSGNDRGGRSSESS